MFGICTTHHLISSIRVFLKSRKMSFFNVLSKSQLSPCVCFGTCVYSAHTEFSHHKTERALCVQLACCQSTVLTSCDLNGIDSCTELFHYFFIQCSFINFFNNYLLSTYSASGTVKTPGDKQQKKKQSNFSRLTSK